MTSASRPVRVGIFLALLMVVVRFVAVLPLTYDPLPGSDFPAYHRTGQWVASGETRLLYVEDAKHFFNMPIMALVFAPLGFMEYERAWRVMWWTNLSSIVATLGLLLLCVRRFFPPLTLDRAMLAAVCYFAFGAVFHRSLVLGQPTPVLVLMLGGAYALLRVGRPALSGVLLGLIGLIKIPPLALIAFLTLRRRIVMAVAAAGTLGMAVALSLVVFGSDLNRQYLDRVVGMSANKAVAAHNNQSLISTWMRLFTDRGLADWRFEVPPIHVTSLAWAGYLLILGLILWRCRPLLWPARAPDDSLSGDGTLEPELGVGITAMLLVFPVAWIHYYQFLVVPVTMLPFWWQKAGLRRHWPTILMLVVGALLAAGPEVRASPYYTRLEHEAWFRLVQSSRSMGAVLLLFGFTGALALCRSCSGRRKAKIVD